MPLSLPSTCIPVHYPLHTSQFDAVNSGIVTVCLREYRRLCHVQAVVGPIQIFIQWVPDARF